MNAALATTRVWSEAALVQAHNATETAIDAMRVIASLEGQREGGTIQEIAATVELSEERTVAAVRVAATMGRICRFGGGQGTTIWKARK